MKTVEQRKTHRIDADGKIIGRLASETAKLLMGKHKPTYVRNSDNGDFVVIAHAHKMKVTGEKLQKKIFYVHSGYPGHLKATTLSDRFQSYPERVLRDAVYGMLPKNKLRDRQIKRLIFQR